MGERIIKTDVIDTRGFDSVRVTISLQQRGQWSPTPPTESGIFWYRIPGRGERLLVDYDHTKGSFEQWGAGFQQTHEETDGEFWSERIQEPPA